MSPDRRFKEQLSGSPRPPRPDRKFHTSPRTFLRLPVCLLFLLFRYEGVTTPLLYHHPSFVPLVFVRALTKTFIGSLQFSSKTVEKAPVVSCMYSKEVGETLDGLYLYTKFSLGLTTSSSTTMSPSVPVLFPMTDRHPILRTRDGAGKENGRHTRHTDARSVRGRDTTG